MKHPYSRYLCLNQKIWEVRAYGLPLTVLELGLPLQIAIEECGTGVVGWVWLVAQWPTSHAVLKQNKGLHKIEHERFYNYSNPWVWECRGGHILDHPIPYLSRGAVIFSYYN